MARRTRYAIALVLWLLGFFLMGFGVWSFQAGHLMVLIYIGISALTYIILAFTVRCRRCRWPVLLRPRRFLGIDLYTWTLLPPKKCRHCGEPLE